MWPETAGYLVPGYTYGQQARPTTAGHYLSAVCAELLRDAGGSEMPAHLAGGRPRLVTARGPA